MKMNTSSRILMASLLIGAILHLSAGAQDATRRTRGDGYGPGMPDDVVVQYDEETESVIVITDEETNKHIGEVIQELDRPVPQVLIRVLFLEVTHSDGLDLGVEFFGEDKGSKTSITSATVGSDGSTTFETNTEVVRDDILETVFGVASETTGGFYRLTREDLSVTVRALAEVAKLEVLSRPSILTRNNQEAVITVGQEVPFIRNTRILQDGQQLNTVEYEDIGIILQVTPHITGTELVAMDVVPEISTLTGETVAISDTVSAPVFAKRSAETGVVVPNGETVVIGGLMEDQETISVSKVPVLGDVPLLGGLFKRKVNSKTKTELLIFLTPYIVPEPCQLAQISQAEKAAASVAPTAFSEEQLERYVGEWAPSAAASGAEKETGESVEDQTTKDKPSSKKKVKRGILFKRKTRR